jgi:transglutaminase superfamily protein
MPDEPLSPAARAALAARILRRYAVVRARLFREPLPGLASRLGRKKEQADGRRHSAAQLSRAVDRTLRLGSRRPSCLASSLVLYSLLREQGDAAELAIGLRDRPTDKTAHSWVELDGVDVGPPPGSHGHVALAHFGP